MKQKRTLFISFIILAVVLLFFLAYTIYSELVQKHSLENTLGKNVEHQLDESDKSDVSDEEDESDKPVKAPDFEVLDSEGNTVKLSDFIGKPVVINYWASWCGPCKMEMPDFNEAYSEVGEDVHFLMINVVDGRRETETSGREYVESQGFEFPVYYDIGLEASLSYGITSYPTTIFIDEEGYPVTGYIGAISKKTLLDTLYTITN